MNIFLQKSISPLLLNDYQNSIDKKNIIEQYRLKFYRNTIVLFIFVYLSLFLTSGIEIWLNQTQYFFVQFLCISIFVSYFLLNKHKNARFTYIYSIIVFYVLLHIASYGSGGVKNSGGAYLLCLILYSYILAGKRAGIIFAVACLLHFVYFYLISVYTNWIDFSMLNNDPAQINLDYVITFIICTLIIWVESLSIEKLNNEIIQHTIDSSAMLAQKEKEEIRLQQLVAENNLSALHSQMNPHFVFNSLNSLSNFILKADTANANLYLNKFSSLVRMILQQRTDQQIVLSDEIRLLELYLELEKIRFGDKLTYTLSVIPSISKSTLRIPSMVIQPFVENAIRNCIRPATETKGIIAIHFSLTDTKLVCTVEDNAPITDNTEDAAAMVQNDFMDGTNITRKRIDLINSMQEQKIEVEINERPNSDISVLRNRVKISFPVLTV